MGFEIDPDLIENDKLVLEEDVDGNLIYRHKSTNAEFVYHVGKSAWLPREGLDLDGGNVTNVGTLDVKKSFVNAGDASATPIRLLQDDGSNIGLFRTELTPEVSTTAKVIFNVGDDGEGAFRGGLIIVTGSQPDSTKQFTDIISYVRTSGTVRHSDERGTVPARTYSFGTSDIELSMESEQFDVATFGMGADSK